MVWLESNRGCGGWNIFIREDQRKVKHHPLKREASEFSVNGQSKDWAYTHFLGVTSGASRPR